MKNTVIKYLAIISATIIIIIALQCHSGSEAGGSITPPIETSTTDSTNSITNTGNTSNNSNSTNTQTNISSGTTSSSTSNSSDPGGTTSSGSTNTSNTSGGTTTESTGATNQLPLAKIVSPVDSACIANDILIINGTTTDSDGTISSIDLRIDNVITTVSGISVWTVTSSILSNGLTFNITYCI